eukprot:gnl/TRDRNA2_/TRDRNA2_127685_c2_seq1.p1 gnl/TRDRNA2_/TRDRNA2_127685_c2~~gnl/TRDRNA2_/TRDRNA2_127685_c2_seq1.p1  ORF type:complete len:131 (-),score=32.56 gnl/TRDRNA2_/TRDRNA2_127685_c2_seq1:234-605(-)
MEPNKIRIALLSMIRAGGVFGIDLVSFGTGVDLDILAQPFETVRTGLLKEILSRDILKRPKPNEFPRFTSMVTKQDQGFEPGNFDEARIAKFKFVVLMECAEPHEELVGTFDTLHVKPGENYS